MARHRKGRQRVEMAKMTNESNLQVTFSKRRNGVFKKASELCTLCGAEIAIIVFSPGKKAFSFGHPSVETVLERFLTRAQPQLSNTMQLVEVHRNATIRELNLQFTQVMNELEMERKRGEELSKMRQANSSSDNWWDKPIDEMNLSQLEQLKSSLQELKQNVSKQADMLLIQNTNAQQFFPSTSSNPPLLSFNADNINSNDAFAANAMPAYGQNLGFGHGFF